MHTRIAIVLIASLAATGFAQHDHEGDYAVGVSGSGMLGVEGDFDEARFLEPFNDGGVRGWFGDEPGFASLDGDEPDEDFFMLSPGADIHFELVSAEPAFKVYDPFFALMTPGDSFALGGNQFDEHPFWHIDSDDPAFDVGQSVWDVSWRLIDAGTTGYQPSEVYTTRFTNVPAPGALAAMLALGAGAAARRRR